MVEICFKFELIFKTYILKTLMDKEDKCKVKHPGHYRGADINKAGDCKVDAKMVKDDTKELNNNPRNHEI